MENILVRRRTEAAGRRRGNGSSGKSAVGIGAAIRRLASTVSIVLVVCGLGALDPGEALALWPVDGDGGVLVGFHETYETDSGEHLHYGVDCSADEGSAVYSPVSGTVSFVGQVPAGETSGCGTMTAISIKMEDGNTLTLMPFETHSVEEGDTVTVGQSVGVLASSGDKSSSAIHLHVGLKNGSTYLDPSYLLGIDVSSSGTESSSTSSTVLAAESDSLAVQVQEVLASEVAGVANGSTAVETVTDSAATSSSGTEEVEASAEAGETGFATISSSPYEGYVYDSSDVETATGETGLFAAIVAKARGIVSTTIRNMGIFFSSMGIPARAMWAAAIAIAAVLASVFAGGRIREAVERAKPGTKMFGRRVARIIRER